MINSNATVECKPGSKIGLAFLFPVPILGLLANIFTLVGATLYRKTILRQNYVYHCVASTLIGNVLRLCLSLWDNSVSIVSIQANTLKVNDRNLNLWVICQVTATSMLFVLSFNICALIYVMLDTSYFSSASNHKKFRKQSVSTSKILARKKFKATSLLTLTWLLPSIIAVITITVWNCKKDCVCIHGAEGVLCPNEKCSKIWPPLRKNFLAAQLVLWFVEIFSLLFFVVKGLRDFMTFTGAKSNFNQTSLSNNTGNDFEIINTSIKASETTENRNRLKVGVENEVPNQSHKQKWKLPEWSNWNPRLRLAVILSVLYVVCTSPLAILFFIEVSGADIHLFGGNAAADVILHLYVLLCPILMINYMPNLRRAQVRMIEAVMSC